LKLTVFESTYGLRGISTSNPKAKVLPAPIKGEKLQTEPEEVLSPGRKEPQVINSSPNGRAQGCQSTGNTQLESSFYCKACNRGIYFQSSAAWGYLLL
jgi:hypothetical protein